MDVRVRVDLSVAPQKKHVEQMRLGAWLLADDKSSVRVTRSDENVKSLVAAFTIPKARQIDVVDRIGRQFWNVEDYQDLTIWFPQPPRRPRRRRSG